MEDMDFRHSELFRLKNSAFEEISENIFGLLKWEIFCAKPDELSM